MSIVNGLFSGRAGIGSHGAAIAVVGDNISNSSTIGYKASRAEFEDLIAGGQATGKTIGSGSQLAATTANFTQGTLEFTSRPLDLAIDGNGFFVVADGAQRFYTRAGNFKTDSAGNIVDQNGFSVLGFPTNGTGALAPLNINNVSSSTSPTSAVTITGNLDANAAATVALANAANDTLPAALQAPAAGSVAATPTYTDLSNAAAFQTVVDVIDSLGQAHTVTVYFFKDDTDPNQWVAAAYVNSEDVGDTPAGVPRLIAQGQMDFASSGLFDPATTGGGILAAANIPWGNGSSSQSFNIDLSSFSQFAANPNVSSITQDGQGVGAVTSVSISTNGEIFALLDNGENAVIGQLGLVNFSNPEGLQRVGGNLLAQSNESGEPIQGRPGAGTFGEIQSGSLELSTTDIATEFVKLITLQRGFQANSRIITSIDQLLNEIIQLA
ncbi:MAG: flagellar hook protein FlgE [Bdellovibrionales bacterium]|nr:flagellar hook protein FlgE [Bdellovibrionales bacterium]